MSKSVSVSPAHAPVKALRECGANAWPLMVQGLWETGPPKRIPLRWDPGDRVCFGHSAAVELTGGNLHWKEAPGAATIRGSCIDGSIAPVGAAPSQPRKRSGTGGPQKPKSHFLNSSPPQNTIPSHARPGTSFLLQAYDAIITVLRRHTQIWCRGAASSEDPEESQGADGTQVGA